MYLFEESHDCVGSKDAPNMGASDVACATVAVTSAVPGFVESDSVEGVSGLAERLGDAGVLTATGTSFGGVI